MAGERGGPGKREQGPDHVGLVRNRREFGVYLRAIGTNWMIRSRVRPALTWAFKGPRDSVKHRLKGPGMEAVGRPSGGESGRSHWAGTWTRCDVLGNETHVAGRPVRVCRRGSQKPKGVSN